MTKYAIEARTGGDKLTYAHLTNALSDLTAARRNNPGTAQELKWCKSLRPLIKVKRRMSFPFHHHRDCLYKQGT